VGNLMSGYRVVAMCLWSSGNSFALKSQVDKLSSATDDRWGWAFALQLRQCIMMMLMTLFENTMRCGRLHRQGQCFRGA
jgi:hypothetical protein